MIPIRGVVYITIYFFFGYLTSVHNKWMLTNFGFGFPWILTSTHLGIGGIGSWLLHRTPKSSKKPRFCSKWNWRCCFNIFCFSLLFTFNLAVANMALNRDSLSFNQIIRSVQPILTAFLMFLLDYCTGPSSPKKPGSGSLEACYYLSIFIVVTGLVVSNIGDYYQYSNSPFFSSNNTLLKCKTFTLVGVLLSSIKGIWSKQIQKSQNISAMELIWKISPICILVSLACSYVSGEMGEFAGFVNQKISSLQDLAILFQLLVINSIIAFVLNWSGLQQALFFSSTTSAVLANIKQGLASLIFGLFSPTPIHSLSFVGSLITFIGGLLYSIVSTALKEAVAEKQD